MAIVASELVMYKAASMNDTSSNGGRLSTAVVVSGAKNNAFLDVNQADRVAGVTNFRKVFYKVDNFANLALQNPTLFVEKITNGDDALYIHAGTATDTQASLTGTERLYGAGTLAAAVTAGANVCTVTVEDPAVVIFADGDLVRVSTQPDINTGGVTEIMTIAVGGVGAATGNDIVLTFTAPFANSYVIGNKVASLMPIANIATSFTTPAVTSTAGTLDTVANPITLSNVATIDETWTITFTSATAFSVLGAVTGIVGAGNTTSNTLPNNPDYGQPYFTLPFAAFGGAWLSGDTIVFNTSSATTPVWLKKVVPAGAASLTANTSTIVLEGESA